MQGFCETESCCDYDFVISGLCPSYPANVKVFHLRSKNITKNHLNHYYTSAASRPMCVEKNASEVDAVPDIPYIISN